MFVSKLMKNDHISVIILAAGSSTRMGSHKAFLPYRGQLWIEEILHAYLAVGIQKVLLITIPEISDDPKMQKILTNFTQLSIVVNQHPEKGRSHSLHLAAQHRLPAYGYFLQNIDNPVPSPSILQQMINTLHDGATCTAPQLDSKILHPTLVSSAILEHILSLQNHDWTLKELLLEYKLSPVLCHDRRLMFNLNTPDDWQMYINLTLAT